MIKKRVLVIVPTYRCNAACSDCGTFSSPENRGEISTDIVFHAIDEAASLGFESVVFSGGEATLERHTLFQGIRYASERNFHTRIVTNGWWAKDDSSASGMASELKEHGLREINFSTGDEHIRFVDQSCVVRGSVASLEAGLPVHVMVEKRLGQSETGQRLREKVCRAIKTVEPDNNVFSVQESPWMPIRHSVKGKYEDEDYITARNMYFRAGCDSVLSTYVLQPTGHILSCCGFGVRGQKRFRVGSILDASGLENAIRRAEDDALFQLISEFGPARILHEASKIDKRIVWSGRYGHNCQACNALFRDKKVAEVLKHNTEQITESLLPARHISLRAKEAFNSRFLGIFE